MTKDSTVPFRTSILLTLGKSALFLLTLAILGACANIRTVKMPQDYVGAENEIVITPVEIEGLYIAPSGWGMLFGAAGVVVEHTATESKREALAQNVKEAWADWRPEAVLSDKLAEELTKRGREVIQEDEIIPLPEKIRAQLGPKAENHEAARIWYDPDTTVFDHSTIMDHYSPTVIMEAGFADIGIIGHRVIIVALIKVLNPHTNNVIARKRAVINMSTGKSNPRDPNKRQQYIIDFKANFENALTKAVPKMLDDIGL